MTLETPAEDRVIVLAPSAHDGPVTARILSDHGFACVLVRDTKELCASIQAGAAVAVIAEETLIPSAIRQLSEVLGRQEPWSDLPVILFALSRLAHGRVRTADALAPLGNVTVLDRPVEVLTLVSAVRAALRARRRQYAARAVLETQREADRHKDEFLGMLSHELRNPLAPIRNSTYILRHAQPGSEQANHAQRVIERQTEHLARLVDDLLDVTRIARGKIELRRSNVDLREVVVRAADDFRLPLDDRGVAFRIAVPDQPVWANLDTTRITQIVGNLLTNAAKFTRRGDEVTVSLEVHDREAKIVVRDTGVGIDPALLPTIFDPFVQGERTLARTQGGLGLGLALVKGVTALHGGSVDAESAGRGTGAAFTVHIPLAAPGVTATDGREVAAERRNGGRRVLVVDDNVDAAESLAAVVRMLGHQADVVHDGPSAIDAVRARRPEIVLCDLGLPGMSGYDVAKALRDDSSPAMQLIAVSGYAQPEDIKRAIAAGFDGHIAKPTDLGEIERLLH